jgi:pimeloyl-ACP methyl ester carboxylesterase
VPEDVRRAALVAGLRPRGADFFEEPLPDSLNWPDAPVGYLQFSPAYDVPATQARDAGYLVRTIPGGHFHMLVEPDAVAEMLLDIWRSMRP